MRNAGLPSTRGSDIRHIHGPQVLETDRDTTWKRSRTIVNLHALGGLQLLSGLTDVGRLALRLNLFGGNPNRFSTVSEVLFQSDQVLERFRGRFLFRTSKCSANKAPKNFAFLLL
jgi:hypothetical protein